MKSVNSIYSKKSSRKAKKRRVLLALLMLLLTGVMTATSTFAWFTANKTVSVSTINVNVAASSGLQISVDAKNWKPVITNEDLETVLAESETYPTNTNQLPTGDLAPVSSVGKIDGSNGNMELFLGEVKADDDGSFKLIAEQNREQSGKNGQFVVFDLFFQVTGKTKLYLTNNAKVSGHADKTTGIQNASRIAFIYEGNKPAGTLADTIQALNETSSVHEDGKAKIWEPNADQHVESAIQHAQNTYTKSITNDDDTAVDYYGIKAGIGGGNAQALNSTEETYFEKVTPTIITYGDGISASEYKELFDLEPGVTKIRIYMWIEGQDVDCEDNESGGGIDFDLAFSIDSKAE